MSPQFPANSSSDVAVLIAIVSMLFWITLMIVLSVAAWRFMRAHERLAERHDDLVRALREPASPPSTS